MTSRRAVAWLAVLTLLGLPHCPALAGTTGTLRGRVLDATTQKPLADVTVAVASPSQAAKTTSDASGNFTFLSLAPDTYVVSLAKQGYDSASVSGVTVVSDQVQNVAFDLQRTLKTVGTVHSRASSDVVRPGATSDVYSINAATQAAASAVGGPGGIDYGYSGLATVPGLYVLQGQQGWQQLISVRGGDPGDVAVELDGIPMSRSSDGGTSSTLSSLGQQELQAYTGGTPASADANGLSGFINQVIRTGTYPGFATATLGIGGPAFYHKASIELGGATPSRNFSYFFAASGVNQDYRYCGQDLCGGDTSHFFYPLSITGSASPSLPTVPVYNGTGPAFFAPGATYALSDTADRETIANFHFGIPHRSGDLKDDVQLLYVTSEIFSKFYSSIGDLGGANYVGQALGGTPTYTDINYYTGPVFGPPNANLITTGYFPSSPMNRPFEAPLPNDLREGNDNGIAVLKLQYQHNFNSSSFLRLFGYTNYSNWFINGPVSEFFNYGGQIADFEIGEHAYGFKGIYQNELSTKHLLGLTGSYQYQRNTTYSSNLEGIVTTNLVDSKGNCYNFESGAYASCFTPLYFPPSASNGSCSSSSNCVPTINPAGGLNEYTQFGAPLPGFPSTPTLIPGNPPPGTPAARNGAHWAVTENGLFTDQYDNNIPFFSAVAVTDQWHPNDRLTVNAGLRAEGYQYLIGATSGSQWPARQFWFNAFNRENCYEAGQPLTTPRTIDPTTGVPSACPAGSAPTNLENTPPSSATFNAFLPRLGFTYSLSRDAVLRGSYGRYADSPSSSDEAVNGLQQNLASSLVEYLPLGFNTPFHDERPALADNYDVSLEQHLRGTDYSFKVTPFYRSTQDQIESVPIGFQGDVLGLNVGFQRSYGVEFLFKKGDFDRDGLSWQLSYAYTKSQVRYGNGPTGTNFIDSLNSYIQHYNSFTSACRGGNAQLCGSYGSSNAQPTLPGNGGTIAVTNPYYSLAPQPLFDRNGEYSPYTILPSPYNAAVGYDTPDVLTGLLNFRTGKVALTPSVTFTSGSYYGSPLVWPGYDPTTCTQTVGATMHANTASCNQGIIPLFLPDPYTGKFDAQGSLREPSRLTGNLQITYDVSRKVKVTLALTSLFDSCYQRGYAWDNGNTCVYGELPSNHLAPVGNFYPLAQTPVQLRYPYSSWLNNEWVGYVGQKLPFTAFLNASFKL